MAAKGNNNKHKNEGDGGGDSGNEGALIAFDHAKATVAASSGLGNLLTRAIALDDRLRAALDGKKFKCIPTRDKYRLKKRKKGKNDPTIARNVTRKVATMMTRRRRWRTRSLKRAARGPKGRRRSSRMMKVWSVTTARRPG